MRFSLASTFTALVLVFMVLLTWTISRRKASVFVVIPVAQRTPFGLDISLPTLHGGTLRLAELRGRVVLLNVWATWCYPCRAEMPAMAALYRLYGAKEFTIVAVASDPQGREVVGPFAEAHDLPFPILLDPQNTLVEHLNLPGIPTSYLLDPQGRIALREVGQRDWNHPDMHRLLDALLAEPKTLSEKSR